MYLKPMLLSKAHVLVLEDDAILRAGLCAVLGDVGYTFAEDVNAEDPAGKIDLVLASVKGRQAPKAALDLLDGTVPVILLADRGAWSGFDFLDAANAFVATAVLQRPFARAALLSVVAKVLAEQRPATPIADGHGELPGLAELLFRLEDPHLA